MKLENRQPCEKGGCTSIDDQTHELNQEPITRSFHLPYKPLELTLSPFNFFRIETAFAEYCSLKQYPVRILLLVIFEGEKDRLTLLFEIMDSLRLRSTERKIDSVRNYFSC